MEKRHNGVLTGQPVDEMSKLGALLLPVRMIALESVLGRDSALLELLIVVWYPAFEFVHAFVPGREEKERRLDYVKHLRQRGPLIKV